MGRDGSGALPRVPSSGGVVIAAPVVVTSSRDHGGGGPATGPGSNAPSAGGMRPPPVTSPAATARQGSGSPNSTQPSPRQVRAHLRPTTCCAAVCVQHLRYQVIDVLDDTVQTRRKSPANICSMSLPRDQPCGQHSVNYGRCSGVPRGRSRLGPWPSARFRADSRAVAAQGSLGQQQGSAPASAAQIALPLPGSLLRAPPVTSGAGTPQPRVAAPSAATGATANPAVPRQASGSAPAAGTRSREPSPAAVRTEPAVSGRSAGATAAGAAAFSGASAAMPPPNAGAVASAFATNSAQQRQRASPPESPRDSAGAPGGGGGQGAQHSTAGSPARRVGSLSNWIGEQQQQQQQQHRHGGSAGGYVPATAAIGGHSNPVPGKKLDAAQLPRGPSAPPAAQNHGGAAARDG